MQDYELKRQYGPVNNEIEGFKLSDNKNKKLSAAFMKDVVVITSEQLQSLVNHAELVWFERLLCLLRQPSLFSW